MSVRIVSAVAVALAAVALVVACSSSGDASSSSSSSSGGNGDSGGPRITNDGGGAESGGPGGGIGSITCGAATCPLPQEHCCTYNNDRPPPLYLFACADGTGCPKIDNASDSVALGCSSAANCPADKVCCLVNDNTPTNTASCVAPADCKDDGDRVIKAQLCDPNAAASGCTPGFPCSSMNILTWNLPPGYATCGGKGL
jgi:hypothetical protein